MKVVFSVVGNVDPFPLVWTEMDVIPQEGEIVNLPDLPASLRTVRTVSWYPLGDPEVNSAGQPFVYIVLGPHRG